MKAKKLTRSKIVKKLDQVFSLYIRQRNKDKNEKVECVTCGKRDHYKKLQAGHFISRKSYSTRWNEENVQVQCMGCNVYKYGEQYKFSLWLDKNYGKGKAEELYTKGQEPVKYKDEYLLELIEYYKDKISNF